MGQRSASLGWGRLEGNVGVRVQAGAQTTPWEFAGLKRQGKVLMPGFWPDKKTKDSGTGEK